MPNAPQRDAWLKAALGGSFEPFPWQKRLLDRLLAGQTPRALDLPTGLGKTSVMAIWLVARALGATHLPRRLVYVVDRRAVVDQATGVAESLREWSSQPEVQAALGLSHPLAISTLRGQFIDNRAWLEDPAAPAIIVGTVDMVGSRLLFEGYACSRKMRPFHAGLLACDTLFILDEAHLVPPFEHLLDGARADALWPLPPVEAGTPLQVLSLSATGRDYADAAFRLHPEDHEHPEVARRLHASKAVTWVDVPADAKLADALAEHAWQVAEAAGQPSRVIVFSNSRDNAEKALLAVQKRAKSERERGSAQPAVELLVGGRRIRDRQAAEGRLRTMGFLAGESREPLVDHAFLFTTSAGEVGVDLDADHAVADIVAWERMVQRLGRVNRRGQGKARVVLLAQPVEGDQPDWAARVRPLVQALPYDEAGFWQAGPSALGILKADHADEIAAASTPAPLYPPLSMPLLEAWSMTSLADHTGRPEVRPWLRGWVDEEAQTTIAWRHYLPIADLAAYFEAMPVHQTERLDTSTDRVVSWLTTRANKLAAMVDDQGKPVVDPGTVIAVVLDNAGEVASSLKLGDLSSVDSFGKKRLYAQFVGKQIVVDAQIAGLSDQGLLDDKHDKPPATVDHDDDWLPEGPTGPVVRARVRRMAADSAPVARQSRWSEALRTPLKVTRDDVVLEWLVIETWRSEATSEESRSASHPQTLVEHQSWAATEAAQIAERLSLPASLREALVVAARLHDEGKQAARWQRAFSAPSDATYAKTRGPVRVRLLDGYRHELGSLPYAEADAGFKTLTADQQSLVLHLIAAHHGSARPTIQTSGCDDAPPSIVQRRAAAVALRFVELQDKWGPWRLAWLEALLRAADQRASRRNDQREA